MPLRALSWTDRSCPRPSVPPMRYSTPGLSRKGREEALSWRERGTGGVYRTPPVRSRVGSLNLASGGVAGHGLNRGGKFKSSCGRSSRAAVNLPLVGRRRNCTRVPPRTGAARRRNFRNAMIAPGSADTPAGCSLLHRYRLAARCLGLFAATHSLHLVIVISAAAQPGAAEQLAHFEWVRTIALSDPGAVHPDTLLIGWIWSLDVAPDGRLLVVDYRAREILLFDPEGKLLAVPDPVLCHPGFEAAPVIAKFVGDQSIFVSNGGSPRGYRFTSDGDCQGNVDPDFGFLTQSGFLDVGAQGSLIGVYRFPDRQVVRRMDASGKTLHEFDLPSSKFPNATRRIAEGGLVADERHIFYAGVAEPSILKLTLEGNVVAEFSQRTAWFRDVSNDLRETGLGIEGLGPALGEFRRGNTLTTDIFELAEEAIIIQYRNSSRGSGYQVFTKDGELVAEELGVQVRFDYGADGLAYRVVQPSEDELAEIPNHSIEVYRFVPPM